jgi:hypothetical protein
MRFYFLSLSTLMSCALLATTVFAQDLDPKDVITSLEQALPIAIAKAKAEFPDLDDYILFTRACSKRTPMACIGSSFGKPGRSRTIKRSSSEFI